MDKRLKSGEDGNRENFLQHHVPADEQQKVAQSQAGDVSPQAPRLNTSDANSGNTGPEEIYLDELPAANLIDRLDWEYDGDGRFTILIPKEGRSPLEDTLHEYLTEVGEPLE